MNNNDTTQNDSLSNQEVKQQNIDSSKGAVVQTRYLEISNFKNIGVSMRSGDEIDEFELDEVSNFKDNLQRIYLNSNYNEDKMGGVVIFVGENGMGKTNSAKSLAPFRFVTRLKDSDKPNFPDYEGCTSSLKLVVDSNYGGGGVKPLLPCN